MAEYESEEHARIVLEAEHGRADDRTP